ncbi:hypothetical protein IWX91DRAFT_15314 [Phyllosticta citricarpa]
MAVLAHVRHKHTDYDRLLKEVGYIEARKAVEKPCIEKILEWRGEGQEDDEEMEDDFREVIILDDDDDDSDVETSGSGQSSPSMELVANEATDDDLGPRDPVHAQASWTEPRARIASRPSETTRPPRLPMGYSSQRMQARPLYEPTLAETRLSFRGFDERNHVRLIPIEPPQAGVRLAQHEDARWPYGRPVARAGDSVQERYEPMPHRHRNHEVHLLRPGPSPMNRHSESVQMRTERQELPSPRDIAVPSIENEPTPYISHQERSFMQASKRSSDADVIDLTGTPPREQLNGPLQTQSSRYPNAGRVHNETAPAMLHERDTFRHRDVEFGQRDRYAQHNRFDDIETHAMVFRRDESTAQVPSPTRGPALRHVVERDRAYRYAEPAPRRVEYRELQYFHPNQHGPSQRAHALIPVGTDRGWDEAQYRRLREPPSAGDRRIDHDAATPQMRFGRPAQPPSYHSTF